MSTFEEAKYCSQGEYEAWRPSRLVTGAFVVGQLEVGMFLLGTDVPRQRAVRYPIRILHVEQKEPKTVDLVRFSFINADRTDGPAVEALFHDGFWGGTVQGLTQRIGEVPIETGYIRGDTEAPSPWLDELQQFMSGSGGASPA